MLHDLQRTAGMELLREFPACHISTGDVIMMFIEQEFNKPDDETWWWYTVCNEIWCDVTNIIITPPCSMAFEICYISKTCIKNKYVMWKSEKTRLIQCFIVLNYIMLFTHDIYPCNMAQSSYIFKPVQCFLAHHSLPHPFSFWCHT